MRSSAAQLALVLVAASACSRTPEAQPDTATPTARSTPSRAPAPASAAGASAPVASAPAASAHAAVSSNGNFQLPLTLAAHGQGAYELTNHGPDAIRSLFLVTIDGDNVRFNAYERIGANSTLTLAAASQASNIDQLVKDMSQALVNEGLYRKEADARHANGRLPNTVRVDADLPASKAVPTGSVDVAVTAMNFHDVYNRDPKLGTAFMQGVYSTLKPGGAFGIVDHVGVAGANNTQLHRVPKQAAIDAAKAAGFVVEGESLMLAHSNDDHTKVVFDPALRGKTDQFVLRLRKPK